MTARAIDARSGETRQGLDPKDESAVGTTRPNTTGTIPNNDPSPLVEVTEADREAAAAIRHALYRACPHMPSYPVGITEPYLAQHRLTALRTPMPARVEAAIPADEVLGWHYQRPNKARPNLPDHVVVEAAGNRWEDASGWVETPLRAFRPTASSTDAPARVTDAFYAECEVATEMVDGASVLTLAAFERAVSRLQIPVADAPARVGEGEREAALREALGEAVAVLERLPYGDWPGPMYSGKVAAANGLIRRANAALATTPTNTTRAESEGTDHG